MKFTSIAEREVALDAKPSNNAEEFTTSSIKDVKVRWAPSDRFKSLINEATFTYVGSREAQAEARKAEKLALNDKATIKPGDEPEVTPDDGGGNSGDDGGLGELRLTVSGERMSGERLLLANANTRWHHAM